MLGGIELNEAAAQSAPKRSCSVQAVRGRSLRRSEHARTAVEEVGSRMCDPAPLGAGDRMSADEHGTRTVVRLDRLDQAKLRAPGVGNQNLLGAMSRGMAHVVSDAADGRANDGHIGLGDPTWQLRREIVDCAEADGCFEVLDVSTDPDNVLCSLAGAKRHADRAANQPDADNRHRSQSIQVSRLTPSR